MTPAGPTLFAAAATVQALSRARAAVVLIGGYDGSGNYGDIAQLDAALALVERLGPGVLALPVLEREYLATHRGLLEETGAAAPQALFFDPDGSHEDDLVAVAAPVELAFGACYLYGGGYLNRLWGGRKLAMLGAAEALLRAGGVEAPYRVSSGLQVEPEWVAGEDGAQLRRFDLHGARDGESRRALAALEPRGSVLEVSDDAVGVLGCLTPGGAAPGGAATEAGPFQVNLHFAEHDWMGERPQAVLDFCLDFVTELGRRAGRAPLAQPLIAYLDPRVDERGVVERLRRACAERGIEAGEPLVLRSATVAAAAPRLRAASLTLSCSYHVALTSLMLEVPAVLIGDNAYYEQKAAGLREAFSLPPAFTASAEADPLAKAGEVAAALLDDGHGDDLRRAVAAGAATLRLRRAGAEIELLGGLGGAAAQGLRSSLDQQAERLLLRSVEPAELHARLAAQQTEREQAGDLAAAPLLAAELRAQEAEATLEGILRSRSWRAFEPLRRLRARLRRG